MAVRYTLQPENPPIRKIAAIVEELHKGAVIMYPTDTVYAIGCEIGNKEGQERIRNLRDLPEEKPLTFLVDSISTVADYAVISDIAFKVIRKLAPGPFTFLLPSTKLVPRLVANAKRTTTGIRIPDHIICHSLLAALAKPVISMSAKLPDDSEPLTLDELFEQFENKVDIIVDDGTDFYRSPYTDLVSTMIDFTGDEPLIVREGMGLELAMEHLI